MDAAGGRGRQGRQQRQLQRGAAAAAAGGGAGAPGVAGSLQYSHMRSEALSKSLADGGALLQAASTGAPRGGCGASPRRPRPAAANHSLMTAAAGRHDASSASAKRSCRAPFIAAVVMPTGCGTLAEYLQGSGSVCSQRWRRRQVWVAAPQRRQQRLRLRSWAALQVPWGQLIHSR